MIPKRVVLIAIFSLIGLTLYSQQGPKLDRGIKVDTLRVWINYPADFNNAQIIEYDSIFDSMVTNFNRAASFVVLKDSLNLHNRIIMNMESIKYVDTKRNILSTGLSLALIGGIVYMISSYGWTIPIWPILLPGTVSKVNLQIDPKMVSSRPIGKTWIGSNGYLMKKDKQEQKFKQNFNKDIYKFLKKIDKQNIKNNKP